MAYLLQVDGTETPIIGKLTLKVMQKAVGGMITFVDTCDKKTMVVNDNGIAEGLQVNTKATNMLHPRMLPWQFNVILGDVIVATTKEIK